MRNRAIAFLCLPILILFLVPTQIFAQTAKTAVEGVATLGVARMVAMKDKNVKNGVILTSSPRGAIPTAIAYDPQVIGVVARDAGIIISSNNVPDGVPVISTGTVYMQVSSRDGAIKKGDLLASSTIPGVAVKAVKSGYVLGTAIEDYSSSNTKEIAIIAVDFNLHYYNSKPTLAGTLTDIFKIALLPTKDSPAAIYKYIVAASVVLGSFVLTFMTFGRTAAKGVEALGRNPAASRIIHVGIIFNVGVCVVITAVGLLVAFLILRL